VKTPDKPPIGPADAPSLPSDARPRVRKPYEKPQFVREQLFETMALACGKTNPTVGQCKLVKKNS
jgi:hypothetical protein